MPIPYRDQDEVDELGTAAFLSLQMGDDELDYRAALFQINVRGEPVEFTYNRIHTPSSFLWRAGDLRRLAISKLTMSLLAACPTAPRIIFCLADQVPGEVFCEYVRVQLPVCRILSSSQVVARLPSEILEEMNMQEPLSLLWFPAVPAEGSPERRLTQRLGAHGLLVEPFERASMGLHEVYDQDRSKFP